MLLFDLCIVNQYTSPFTTTTIITAFTHMHTCTHAPWRLHLVSTTYHIESVGFSNAWKQKSYTRLLRLLELVLGGLQVF